MSRWITTACVAAFGLFALSATGAVIPIYIVAGQSNAAGFATNSDLLTPAQLTAQSNVLYPGEAGPSYSDPVQWRNLQAPTQYIPAGHTVAEDSGGPNSTLSQNYNHHGFGPEYTLGQTLSQLQGGQTVGIVKYSGVTNLHDAWQPTFQNSSSYNGYNQLMHGITSADPQERYGRVAQALDRLSTQVGDVATGGVVAGFFWMQGEADAQDLRTTAQYETDLINFIAQVRADAGNPNLPFIYGLINNAGGTNDQIRQAQMDVAANINNGFAGKVANTFLVNTDSYERDPNMISINGGTPVADTVHFDNQGQMQLGVGMANGFAAVAAPEPASLALLGLAIPLLVRRRR